MPHLPGKQGMWDDKTRTPWNNIIFPGNYVAHLNAYRNQGVTALPGYNFFRLVGALVLKPENNCVPPLLDPVTGLLPLAPMTSRSSPRICAPTTSPGSTVPSLSPLVPSCIAPRSTASTCRKSVFPMPSLARSPSPAPRRSPSKALPLQRFWKPTRTSMRTSPPTRSPRVLWLMATSPPRAHGSAACPSLMAPPKSPSTPPSR